jgi:hypothetical protein
MCISNYIKLIFQTLFIIGQPTSASLCQEPRTTALALVFVFTTCASPPLLDRLESNPLAELLGHQWLK